ncbi:hypothetical protein SPRG_13732 [Saprolegnia parasitica CBS 223.65]|uniref:Helicase-associated domain-containing protein n=1 Tax=Saprolegnia parasitica (strain CBS 223.65) TaxID=695850 RepID=A0A067BSM0_SAPPC|nr:hypothetical protein SPRG_13732 [Saprolegnia parasitica CBS 223.65]KDO21233.1 hypothetical protein SPRG_13732 [Saprolegnia parasitica CBS 223.65]|eukprot:XP_012208065.1 hypothetical protein SPRG_13732 [Saprolegnia parasitica CBS 223.65]
MMMLARARGLQQRWRSSLSPAYTKLLDIVRIERNLQAPRSDVTYLPTKYQVPFDDALPSHSHGHTIDVSALRGSLNELKHSRHTKLHGNVLVAQDFVLPDNDPLWSKDAWGFKLGIFVSTLRSGGRDKCPAPRRAGLDALGFVRDWLEKSWNLRIQALTTYKELHGDLIVPQSFVVPDDDVAWPTEMRGMRLGLAVNYIRHREEECPLERKAQLDALGFERDCLEENWNFRIAALTKYKELHSDLLVAALFAVPNNDAAWPNEFWGIKISSMALNLRGRESLCPPERKAELDALGFRWKIKST